MLLILGALACVLATATGQVLFKAGAISINEAGSIWATKPLTILVLALALYFATSLGWVMLLKRASLGQIYPLMALSFVVVPLASFLVFGEQFSNRYIVGVLFIMIGIVLCVRS